MAPISLSYILLTYNQRDTVGAAVRSALAQDVHAMDIVISDDCSSDGTFDEIEAAVANYQGPHRLVLNRNPENLGLAGNLDKAHQLSTGEVIIAAAGDDISYPHRSQRILDAFVANDPLLVCSYAKVIGPDGSEVPGDFRTALFYKNWDLERAARSKALYIGATGAWHRSLYSSYGPIDPESYEDLVLGFRAALEARVTTIDEELVQYRLGTGITSSAGYHTDIAAFERQRKKRFVAQQAVMRQRIKDARHFGLDERSAILRILRKEQMKATLRLSYYEDRNGEFRRQWMAHPLLGVTIWRSERRRRRKMMRQMQLQTAQDHG
ncbi:glycosyltransferase [Thioclava atlantica]|uniref:Glycosyl transferase n=1 Tax=Thioclava atlantica TaxID=1317124 RepID=A0A085TZL9_9RHOB|nr:glycosyltransferase [Thioclava atlantica]KFE36166.1 glycosyl transferase [Thioclava atlantica]